VSSDRTAEHVKSNNWLDYAVLVMAIHSALQVFNPVSQGCSDGLFNYRYYIYLGGFIVPGTMSGLAFVNPDSAYLFQGVFCTLPLRPLWYRLTLAWIPRYLIALVIICLATAIYAYIGFEFRSYANLTQEMQTQATPMAGLDLEAATDSSPPDVAEQAHHSQRRASSVAHDAVVSQYQGSAVAFMATTYSDPSPSTQSWPGSSTPLPPRGSTSRCPPLFVVPSGYFIKPSNTNDLHGPISPLTTPQGDPLSSVPLTQPSTALYNSVPAQCPLQYQRRRMHRQLRLMFIYPLAYTLMWLIPFIQHCMSYSDVWVAHPVWFLTIGATVCITSMGFVDCLIFSVREKPWRSIQTSDGTVWGSLAVWRARNAGRGEIQEMVAGVERSMSGNRRLARIRGSVRISASDDFTRIAAEQARARLEGEREERTRELQERVERGQGSTSSKGEGVA
jgi:hypothetical protein